MKSKFIVTVAALSAAVLLSGCVEERYYGDGGYYGGVGRVRYEPIYSEPYYGGNRRYDNRRYDRDRRNEGPRRPDYARPDNQRPGRIDNSQQARPSPAPVAVQPQAQRPRAEARPSPAYRCVGIVDASGVCVDPRGRGEGWGKTN